MERVRTTFNFLRTRYNESRVQKLPRSERTAFLIGFFGISIIILLGAFASLLAPFSPYAINTGAALLPPGSYPYILGTDSLGRDLLSRMMHGAQTSLLIGLSAVLFATAVGGTLGVLMGYFRGGVDRLLTLVMDALYSFPAFLIALLIVTTMGGGIVFMALAVGFGMTPRFYRSLRSVSITLKEEEFVEAELSLGASDLYIVFKHVYPLCFSVLLVMFTVSVATAILTIAGLGFLGLGVPTPIPEWGTDLNQGRPYILSGIWWTTMIPAVFIFITVLGFNLIGDGLNKMLGAALEEI